MRPPRWSSLIFVAGVLLVFGALGWATFHALRLERLEAEARAMAQYQESLRLALWRMDSRITPIIAREAARPYFQYRPFYPTDRAYTRMLNQVEPGEVLVPSPLLQNTDPLVKLYFERDGDGSLSSPQVPTGDMRKLAESVYVTGYAVASSSNLLDQLGDILDPNRKLAQSLRPQVPNDTQDVMKDLLEGAARDAGQGQSAETDKQVRRAQSHTPVAPGPVQQQLDLSANEYLNRAANAQEAQKPSQTLYLSGPTGATKTASGAEPESAAASKKESARSDAEKKPGDAGEQLKPLAKSDRVEFRDAMPAAGAAPPANEPAVPLLVGSSESGVVQGQFTGKWVPGPKGEELVYTRDVDAGGQHLTQGFWINWPSLRDNLLTDARDLLPGATLRPLLSAPDLSDQAVLGRTLAALPAEIVAPPPAMVSLPAWSPVRSTLLATWIAALGAMIAIALVLRTAMELAERRGRFVSAVTHELRTPLTTFCLYSQMLADGMVQSEESRRSYVQTLSTESQRLARIVESVLEYARLGRRHGGHRVRAGAAEIIDGIVPGLRKRCEQAGMQLEVSDSAARDAKTLIDAATLERVLFNLVDNACKYASGAQDKRVHLTVTSTARDLSLTVKDHGPGLERHDQKRVFRPFVRGHKQGDGSIPGLGLGLSLSQGLVKEMRGELKLVPSDHGAEFRLTLPLA